MHLRLLRPRLPAIARLRGGFERQTCAIVTVNARSVSYLFDRSFVENARGVHPVAGRTQPEPIYRCVRVITRAASRLLSGGGLVVRTSLIAVREGRRWRAPGWHSAQLGGLEQLARKACHQTGTYTASFAVGSFILQNLTAR